MKRKRIDWQGCMNGMPEIPLFFTRYQLARTYPAHNIGKVSIHKMEILLKG